MNMVFVVRGLPRHVVAARQYLVYHAFTFGFDIKMHFVTYGNRVCDDHIVQPKFTDDAAFDNHIRVVFAAYIVPAAC